MRHDGGAQQTLPGTVEKQRMTLSRSLLLAALLVAPAAHAKKKKKEKEQPAPAAAAMLASKACAAGQHATFEPGKTLELPGFTNKFYTLAALGKEGWLVSTVDAIGFGPTPTNLNPAPGTSYSTSALADLDGDGNDDLVWANYREDLVILFGKGKGRWQNLASPMHVTVPHAANLLSVVTADVNGDGRPDLISAGDANKANGITVILNEGQKKFARPDYYETGFQTAERHKDGSDEVYQVLVTDVTGDGKPDLVGRGSFSIQVFVNEGGGKFAKKPKWVARAHEGGGSMVVADFNGDQKPDVALVDVSEYDQYNVVEVLLGNGDGTFDVASDQKVGPQSNSIYPTGRLVAADLNGDGKVDLAFTLWGRLTEKDAQGRDQEVHKKGVGVLQGNGDGTFKILPPVFYPVEGHETVDVLTAGDFDGDGMVDLAVPQSTERVDTPAKVHLLMGKCAAD
jgi:hypothetical protein